MLNKVILMGRLCADPEMRQTGSGVSVTRIRVAVDRNFTAKGQERQADFINCTAWRATAEFISKYFTKGKMIVIEGSLRNNDYTDNNGVKHYSMDVQIDNAMFGETKSGGNAGEGTFRVPEYADQAPTERRSGNGNSGSSASNYSAPDESLSLGDMEGFEEILSDGDVPF